ncbi:hypothetical protein [Cellulomonas sp. ICMP 17802]|uniref:hypothetical protein n=1 Tax=Cellulomonas sp. ICMP 17802 TaxID=3239199 RepID=UPI00351AC6C1
MPSSESTGAGRGFLWFVVIANAVLGGFVLGLSLAMLVARGQSTWSVPAALLGVAVGLGWVGLGSVGFHRTYLHRAPQDGRSVTTQPVDGVPALVLPWRSTLLLLPMLTVAFLVLVLVGVAAALLRDGNGGAWLVVVLAALLALLLPDTVLRAARDPRVVLTAQGIGARGWDGDAWLDWDDVASAELVNAGQFTLVRFHGAPGAPSWRWSRRRRFLVAPQPRAPWIDVPAPALDIDAGWFAGIVLYYAHTPSARAEIGGDVSRRRLVEHLDPRT